MRFYKYLFLTLAAISFTSSLIAVDERSAHDEELNERDLQALRDFLRQKRHEAVEENPEDPLTITGDVRTEWRHMNEKIGHALQRGGRAVDCDGTPLSRNDFDIEANLLMIYNADRTWATMHLQFDNAAGIDDTDCFCSADGIDYCSCNRFHGSGDGRNLNLKRAFMGYNVWSCGDNQFDVELGRRRLYDVLDSEIQFLNRCDGLLLKFSGTNENWGDYYAKLLGFVVDERVNHFAWATELGFLNIHNSGFDLKYSFIDWSKRGHNRCFQHNPRGQRYRNSQVTASYHLDEQILCRPMEIFGAVVYNHSGNQVETSTCFADECASCDGGVNCVPIHGFHKNKNFAWYAGFLIGDVEKEGDWSFEFQYQWVQENAISFDDEAGICLGDFLAECCGHGPTPGYKGWLIDILYAFTDDLTVDMTIESARKNQPGPHHTYSKFELEAIYAF